MLDADRELLFNAVREAGQLGLAMADKPFQVWHKPDGSVITEADLAIDVFLKERLCAARPNYGWLSEETPDTTARLSCREIWVVDPIDGTSSFASGRNEWCVSAALVRDGKPALAAVYRPVLDVFYMGIVGGGCWRNDVRCFVNDDTSIADARLIGTKRALASFVELGAIGQSNLNIPLLLRLAMIGAGEIEGAVSIGHKNDWDLVAGALMVTEGGGHITDAMGQPMTFNQPTPYQNGMIAAGIHRHKSLLEHIKL